VLNQAEALVAIDVNSGRATREHHIEDTALKTNLEAADEIARQLRLRDLAGLIVIDFIDMDEKRNNRAVERRLKECLKQDRARIQVGRISHFGLLEMSRQRIRTSVLESSTEKCPYCGGSGHVRSVSSLALQVLRALEEQLMKGATHNLIARTRPDVALYVLNQKRAHLRSLEERFAITVTIAADETVTAPQAFVIDRGEQVHTLEAARARAELTEAQAAAPLEEEDDLEEAGALESDDAEAVSADDEAEHGEAGGRRRRRRRRRGRNGGEATLHAEPHRQEGAAEDFHAAPVEAEAEPAEDGELVEQPGELAAEQRGEPQRDGERRRRRRGRRGGRRNRLEREGEPAAPNDQHPRGREQHFSPMGESPPPTMSDAEPEGVVGDFADFNAEPAATAPQAVSEPMDAQGTAASSSPPLQEQEPPRRRSTVREPAPGAGNGVVTPEEPATPSPSPEQPVAAEPAESEDAARPRRTGWWSRRIAGG
jgi:ribonuclease E